MRTHLVEAIIEALDVRRVAEVCGHDGADGDDTDDALEDDVVDEDRRETRPDEAERAVEARVVKALRRDHAEQDGRVHERHAQYVDAERDDVEGDDPQVLALPALDGGRGVQICADGGGGACERLKRLVDAGNVVQVEVEYHPGQVGVAERRKRERATWAHAEAQQGLGGRDAAEEELEEQPLLCDVDEAHHLHTTTAVPRSRVGNPHRPHSRHAALGCGSLLHAP
eukprot:4036353-Prymnesium_polylepis.1